MLAKGTPSKAPRAADFQRTPRPLPRRSLCNGSPLIWDPGTPHASSPQAAVPPAVQPLPMWPTSPMMPMGLPPILSSPVACTRRYSTATPLAPARQRLAQVSTPHYTGLSPSSASNPSPGGAGQAVGCQRVVLNAPATCSFTPSASLLTPSKVITISTPLRPCARLKAKEMQDEIKAAVEEESVPYLKVALQRRHACPGEHALHEAVRQAHVPAVRLLLRGRAEPNARCLCLERGCEFPLQLAVCSNNFLRNSDRLQAADLLLGAGARPGPRRGDAEANTPLHDAVKRGDLNLTMMLLRHNSDPNAANGFGEKPLQIAVRSPSDLVPDATIRAMVEALLRAGACPFMLGELSSDDLTWLENPELRALIERWSGWWRCRVLAWIRSRGRGHPLCHMMPELMIQVARFL